MPAAIILDEDGGGSCYINCAQQGLQTWCCLFQFITLRIEMRPPCALLHPTADGATARREIFCHIFIMPEYKVIRSRTIPEKKISWLKVPNFSCVQLEASKRIQIPKGACRLLPYSSWMKKSGIAYSPRSANPQVTKIQSCQAVTGFREPARAKSTI
jgi:hypothetical protein